MYQGVLFAFPAILTSAVSDATGRLSNAYNGAENAVVAAERYPFSVSVTLNNKHICGGFIDKPRFIVTTASCVCQKTTSQIQVTVGELSLVLPDSAELKLQVQPITVHEAYDNTTRFNDVAMLEMSQVMEFGPSVNYIVFTEVSGSLAIIMGRGAFDETKMMSIELRGARINSPASCDVFSTDVFDEKTMFCWGRSGYDSGVRPCQYDEGSPLFYPTFATTLYATGIVSKNLGCGDGHIFETIYTWPMVYNDWILRVGGPQH
ncbi:hypothetical protein GHT06_013449 [Daphnia sinensis]|uniref:Peptidase S1 domain-containing protein n=1 Tax=Daphnia sinensis TaxID=1820382 RepID=A0AAD5KS15_9CRUS|nr:hypothetical protein GHT06_013449 [Daphnia sinensis]